MATIDEPAPEPTVAAATAPGPEAIYPVDLARMRTLLPDNLYWEVGAPTQDPRVLERRAAEAQRWNSVYGKVLAGEATEAEIQQYFDSRRRLSEDLLAFASRVLEEYGDTLPERDQGLYALSIRMHRDRLAELPHQQAEALARRQAQEARREAWLRSGRSE